MALVALVALRWADRSWAMSIMPRSSRIINGNSSAASIDTTPSFRRPKLNSFIARVLHVPTGLLS